nr:pyrroline-5-carboxylate reductase [Govania unica]
MGCGRMGSAMLDGWLQQGLDPAAVVIVEPSDDIRGHLAGRAGQLAASLADVPSDLLPQLVVLAVKPQMMDGALVDLAPYAARGSAFLSIAAGKNLAYFRSALGAAPVVRAMPNTPAAIGHGITAAIANDAVTPDLAEVARALLSAVGAFVWLDDEKHMDAVTAVSGSGPAYLFYLTECLAAAGVAAGLPQELSFQLAVHTMAGSGALLAHSGDSPTALREAVTSPAGTTAAALDVLMGEKGLSPLMRQAVMAATKRSRELGHVN